MSQIWPWVAGITHVSPHFVPSGQASGSEEQKSPWNNLGAHSPQPSSAPARQYVLSHWLWLMHTLPSASVPASMPQGSRSLSKSPSHTSPSTVVAHVVTTPGYGWHLRRAWFYANWPALIRAYPEKRALLWKRWFLRRRSAEADLLLLSVVTAGVLTSPWPLVAAAPFVWRHRRSPGKALFDLTVSVALLRGSVRHRTVVL